MTQFETIESRTLFSTTFATAANVGSITLTAGGELDIMGTVHADLVKIQQKGQMLMVKLNNFVKTLPVAMVTSIHIQAGAGNDQIVSDAVVKVLANGGDGNDSIVTGSGNDTDTGGAGNDTIMSGAGNDTDNGDAGNDSVNGGTGDDSVNGGDGDDVLKVGVAVHGAYLFGGNGDDILIGVDIKHDHAIGGNGRDTARGFVKSLLSQVEALA